MRSNCDLLRQLIRQNEAQFLGTLRWRQRALVSCAVVKTRDGVGGLRLRRVPVEGPLRSDRDKNLSPAPGPHNSQAQCQNAPLIFANRSSHSDPERTPERRSDPPYGPDPVPGRISKKFSYNRCSQKYSVSNDTGFCEVRMKS